MNESIYHVYANYCGARKLLFAGYASRVARRLGMNPSQLARFHLEQISIQIAPTTRQITRGAAWMYHGVLLSLFKPVWAPYVDDAARLICFFCERSTFAKRGFFCHRVI